MSREIYLDYSASTPIAKEAVEAMLRDSYGSEICPLSTMKEM